MHKAHWEQSPFPQLGWLHLRDHLGITWPLTQRHEADIEDKQFSSWRNIQPEAAEVLLQIRMRGKEAGTDTAEWHLNLFYHWQCGGTGSSLVIPLKTQGDGMRVAHLLCRYPSLWKYPLTRTQTTECVGDMWIAQDPLTGASFCRNRLVILTVGEQKTAGCLWYCLGAIVFLRKKKMHCFWRMNSNSYLQWFCFFMAYRDGMKLLISWLFNSRDQVSNLTSPFVLFWGFFLEQFLKIPPNGRTRESCWNFNKKKSLLPQCSLIIINVKLIKTQSKTKKKGQRAIILEICSPVNCLLFRL